MTVVIPVATISETNEHAHWSKRHKRAKAQRQTAALVLRSKLGPPPANVSRVKVTRIHPSRRRIRDVHENYPPAMKAVVDGIADWAGVDDSKIAWEYGEQEVGDWGVRVEVMRL